jgi:hypothetical protein
VIEPRSERHLTGRDEARVSLDAQAPAADPLQVENNVYMA